LNDLVSIELDDPTGLVPTFRGNPVLVSEIGFTPGRNATSGTVDNVESRKGYSGLYQFGVAYNPGDFTAPRQLSPILEGEPSSLARRSERSTGLGCGACDQLKSAECQPQLHAAHGGAALQRAAAFGFSQLHIARLCEKQSEFHFLPPGMVAWKTEHGVELNVLLNYGPFLVQPVVQNYANVGGIGGHAVVAGFRTKIDS
jgi:porin